MWQSFSKAKEEEKNTFENLCHLKDGLISSLKYENMKSTKLIIQQEKRGRKR
jgi:hypothetical protein